MEYLDKYIKIVNSIYDPSVQESGVNSLYSYDEGLEYCVDGEFLTITEDVFISNFADLNCRHKELIAVGLILNTEENGKKVFKFSPDCYSTVSIEWNAIYQLQRNPDYIFYCLFTSDLKFVYFGFSEGWAMMKSTNNKTL